MVVGIAGVIAQVAASPAIGALFGLAYGTSIRIGYEQIYPALFPQGAGGKTASPDIDTTISKLNTMYDKIGGKEAHGFGIEQGLNNALKQFGAGDLTEAQKKSIFFSLDSTTEGQGSLEMQQKSITLMESILAYLTFETKESLQGKTGTTGGLSNRGFENFLSTGINAPFQEPKSFTETYTELFNQATSITQLKEIARTKFPQGMSKAAKAFYDKTYNLLLKELEKKQIATKVQQNNLEKARRIDFRYKNYSGTSIRIDLHQPARYYILNMKNQEKTIADLGKRKQTQSVKYTLINRINKLYMYKQTFKRAYGYWASSEYNRV